ncbi:hypothetical protein BOX37_26290 [Nocardia mangyaensis]|uniref:Uncharacterized protein n=1 Tax=Nocardia mangyaensis TaxID=2213200 RepID=A0A1J0VXX8_9NOCA|nr:hypothetical protein BOX37_26290 [Nocardia mangyaensis]
MGIDAGHDMLGWYIAGDDSSRRDVATRTDAHAADHTSAESDYRIGLDYRWCLVDAPPSEVGAGVLVHQVAHDRRPISDNCCVADESGYTGVDSNPNPVANVCAVHKACSYADLTPVPDAGTVLDNASIPECGPFVDQYLVKQDRAIAEHDIVACRWPSDLGFS